MFIKLLELLYSNVIPVIKRIIVEFRHINGGIMGPICNILPHASQVYSPDSPSPASDGSIGLRTSSISISSPLIVNL